MSERTPVVLTFGRDVSEVQCPLLPLSGHFSIEFRCPLLRVKRTSAAANPMSAFDPQLPIFSLLARTDIRGQMDIGGLAPGHTA